MSDIATDFGRVRSTRRVLAIDSRATLRPLRDEVRNGLHRGFRGFTLLAPPLLPDERAAWKARLEKDYFACGCGEATVAALVALLAYFGWRIAGDAGLGGLGAMDVAGAFAAFVAGTLVGKVFGRRRARARLAHSIETLAALLPEGAAPREHRKPCGHAA